MSIDYVLSIWIHFHNRYLPVCAEECNPQYATRYPAPTTRWTLICFSTALNFHNLILLSFTKCRVIRRRSKGSKFICAHLRKIENFFSTFTTPNGPSSLILKMPGNNPFVRSEYISNYTLMDPPQGQRHRELIELIIMSVVVWRATRRAEPDLRYLAFIAIQALQTRSSSQISVSIMFSDYP